MPIDAHDANGYTRLAMAAFSGNFILVQTLLGSGAKPTATNKDGMGPLMWAAQKGHLDIAKLLVAAGADVHARTNVANTALMLAAGNGHESIVSLLLDAGSDVNAKDIDGHPVLLAAVQGCGAPIVRRFLDNGAVYNPIDPEYSDILSNAVLSSHAETVDLLVSRGAQLTWDADTLVILASKGCHAMLGMLFAHGADVNASEKSHRLTPLLAAAAYGQLQMVKYLVEQGADLSARDSFGNTALGLAEMKHRHETAAFLRSITQTEPVLGKPRIRDLVNTGIAGRRLGQLSLDSSTQYRAQVSLSMIGGAKLTQKVTFETNAHGAIINVSDRLITSEMLLMDYSIIGIEDITHNISAGSYAE